MPSLHLEHSVVDDRYEVRRRISHGSYAEIYEAFDIVYHRKPVILKALNATLQGTPEEDLERTLVENFQKEAIALDTVSHPNVVRRLGHGTAADLSGTPFHYLILEYMPGGDLMAYCRRRPLTLLQMLYYVRQVSEALAEAHRRGVIHRDIKPNNLLLSADEQILKITDFGVAKLTDGDMESELTRVGTDIYAPPEHHPNAEGGVSSTRLTPAADVYSLAKTIYALMTGKAPRQFARRPISELPSDLVAEPWGPKLLSILKRATAELPSERYQTVAQMWDELSTLPDATSLDDDDDDDTQVRAREQLRPSDPLPAIARSPSFAPQVHVATDGRQLGGRIVVALPDAPRVHAVGPAGALQTVDGADYSYAEDLRELVGSGWRMRIAVFFLVLALFGAVAVVYVQVQRVIATRSLKTGTVTAPSLTLRDGPSTSANSIGVLPYGTRVRILKSETDGPWFEVQVVQLGGPVDNEQPDRGWVGSKYVAVDGP